MTVLDIMPLLVEASAKGDEGKVLIHAFSVTDSDGKVHPIVLVLGCGLARDTVFNCLAAGGVRYNGGLDAVDPRLLDPRLIGMETTPSTPDAPPSTPRNH